MKNKVNLRHLLVLAGTSETSQLVSELGKKGYYLVVSTATNTPLFIPQGKNIIHIAGRLDEFKMTKFILEKQIQAIVDSTHPYAQQVTFMAQKVAKSLDLPFFRYVRPGLVNCYPQAIKAKDHESAARLAFKSLGAVLLTTGSRNLIPYIQQSRKTSIACFARVLPGASSLKACLQAGFKFSEIIQARGPFSIEQNMQIIQSLNIKKIVTKDSGHQGGFKEKAESAQKSNCKLIVVTRPEEEQGFASIELLLEAVQQGAGGNHSF